MGYEIERGGAESVGKYSRELVRGIITCAGPRGEDLDPDYDDERYWVKLAECSNRDGVATAAETTHELKDSKGDPIIVMGTNKMEAVLHTHLLLPGTEVWMELVTDRSSPPLQRYIFFAMPALILLWIGGWMNALGSDVAMGILGWRAGVQERFVSQPADYQMGFKDACIFQGELHAVGNFHLADGNWYQFIRWDELAEPHPRWAGIAVAGESTINTMVVADIGEGERIYLGCGAQVRSWDGDTIETLTHTTPHDTRALLVVTPEIAAASGLAAGLYAGGLWDSASPCWGLGHWTGSAWDPVGTGKGLGEATADPNPPVYALALHEDERGWAIYAAGNILRAELVVLRNVGRWDGTAWTNPGGGIGLSDVPVHGAVVQALHSFQPADEIDTATGRTTHKPAELYGGGAKTDGNPLNLLDGGSWREAGQKLAQRLTGGAYGESARIYAIATHQGRPWVAGLWHKRYTGLHTRPMRGVGGYDAAETVWDALALGVRGPVYSLCIHAGKLLESGSFARAGNVEAANVAEWDEVTQTHAALGAGLSGPAYAIVEFLGSVLFGGNFVRAGDVEAYYLARWDGLAWYAVGVFNGPIYGIALDADGLNAYIVGRFDHAGGGAGRLCCVGWNGTTWRTLISAITQVDDDPQINSAVVVGDYLYLTGRFNSINGATCNNVARIYLPTGWVEGLVTGAGCNGIDGEGLAITYFNGEVWVGGGRISYDGTTFKTLIKWNQATTTWSTGEGGAGFTWGSVRTLVVSGTTLYVGCRGRTSSGIMDVGCVRTRDTAGTWATLGTPESAFDGEVRAIAVGAAGAAARPYAGGTFQEIGDPADFGEVAEMLVAKLAEDEKYRHMSGGLGAFPYLLGTLGLQSGICERIRSLDWHEHECRTLFSLGDFGLASRRYAKAVGGLSMRGMTGIQEGLVGWGTDAPQCSAILPLAGGGALLGGDFAGAINAYIPEELEDTISATVLSSEVVHFDGRFFRPRPGLGLMIRCAVMWAGKETVAGLHCPYWWDTATTAWVKLTELLGDDSACDLRSMVEFDGELWLAGMQIYVTDPEDYLFVASWNGAAITDRTPDHFSGARAMVTGDMGSGLELFLGGDVYSGSPVQRRGLGGGSWSDVGSNLSGSVYSLAVCPFSSGTVLLVVGTLWVDVDGTSVQCHAAVFDGLTWRAIGFSDGFSGPNCCAYLPAPGRPRAVIAGDFSAMTDIAAEAVVPAANMINWRPEEGLTALAEGGANAPVLCLAVTPIA